MSRRITIAIDGTAGSGKSTLGRRLAFQLGLPYVDSGALYRAIGLCALNSGTDLENEDALVKIANKSSIELVENSHGQSLMLDGQEVSPLIRSPEASQAASAVAVVPEVREAVTRRLRKMALGGVVMEGRDIGTVVLPDADVKIFLDASLNVRAERRLKDHLEQGINASLQDEQTSINQRDIKDKSRLAAPLKPADDACVIDTGNKSLDQLEQELLHLIKEKTGVFQE